MVDESVFRRAAAEELRAGMARREMTQQRMARVTGISVMTIHRHRTALTPMSAHQAQLYAAALDMHWVTDDVSGLPRLDSNQQPVGLSTQPENTLAEAS